MEASNEASRQTTKGATIIAIHGVGDREPGAVLDAILRGLSRQQNVIHAEEYRTYRLGHWYRRAEVRGHPYVESVLEVNWDDISHPARSLTEIAKHFFSLLASTLREAAKPIDGLGPPCRLLQAYGWVFNSLLLWCIFLPIVTIAGFAPSVPSQLAWIFATALLVHILTKLLSPFDSSFRVGRVWVFSVLLVGVASMVGEQSRSIAVCFSTWVYGGVQGIAGLSLLVAMGVSWTRSRTAKPAQRLARLAFLYLPFALFTGVGALIWAGTLSIAHVALPEESLSAWSTEYLGNLIYDLPFAEAVLGTGVAIGGFLLLLPIFALRSTSGGAQVHQRLLTALRIFPLLVLVVSGLFFVHLVVFGDTLFTQGTDSQHPAFDAWIKPWLWPLLAGMGMPIAKDTDPNVLQIYLTSSLRLLPFLGYLSGPSRLILDTVGDVLLYVDPRGNLGAGAVRDRVQKRLRIALEDLIETDTNRTVVVLAHSQGTAIAADVLTEMKPTRNICFVSMGSPISSLYWRFLGQTTLSSPKVLWLNLYRTGDYIAGGTGICSPWAPSSQAKDRSLGAGSHSNYFDDPKVWMEIEKMIAAPSLKSAP